MEHDKLLIDEKNTKLIVKRLTEEHQKTTHRLELEMDRLYENTEMDLPAYSKAHRKVRDDLTSDFRVKTFFASPEMRQEFIDALMLRSQQYMLGRRDAVEGRARANSKSSYRVPVEMITGDRRASPPRARASSIEVASSRARSGTEIALQEASQAVHNAASDHPGYPNMTRLGSNEWDKPSDAEDTAGSVEHQAKIERSQKEAAFCQCVVT